MRLWIITRCYVTTIFARGVFIYLLCDVIIGILKLKLVQLKCSELWFICTFPPKNDNIISIRARKHIKGYRKHIKGCII